MATPEQISAYEQLFDRLVKAFETGLTQQLTDVWLQLAQIGTNPTRTQIVQLFAPIQSYIATQLDAIQQILAASVAMNATVINPQQWPLPVETASLIAEVTSATQLSAQTQQNELIQTVVMSAAAGAGIAVLLRQLRPWIKRAGKSIANAWATAVQQLESAVLRIRAKAAGIDRFQYVGGTIATTRPFCAKHNGKIYTTKEIDQMWKQTWAGKKPGNAFIVRGGFNCRHFWVAVKEE